MYSCCWLTRTTCTHACTLSLPTHAIAFQDFIHQVANGIFSYNQKAEHFSPSTCGGNSTILWNSRGSPIRLRNHLFSYLMKDVCKMLGITILHTTISHPNVMELWKGSIKHSKPHLETCDKIGPMFTWSSLDKLHYLTGKKLTCLIFSFDCCFLTKATLLLDKLISPTNVSEH